MSRRGPGCAGWTVLVVLAAIVTLVVVFAWVVPSQRKWYAIDELRIQDRVLSDGTLVTDERFSYTFHGHYTRVYRDIPWDGHAVTVTGVTGPDGRPLTRLPSGWTPAAGPATEARPGADPTPSPWTSIPPEERPAGYYRVTEAYADWLGRVTRIEAFAVLDDTTADFTFHWRAAGAAERWQDAGELEWQLVGRAWEVPIARVRATVALPRPAPRDEVLAWGHGPLNGVVRVLDDGTVTLAVDDLAPRTLVEVHELFPPRLLSRTEEIPIDVTDRIVRTESRYAKEANAERAAARAELAREARRRDTARTVAGVAALAALVVWLVVYVRNGREYRPRFRERYLRDVPADLPPALVGLLWRMGRTVTDRDLTATLLDLAVKGVVRISEEPAAPSRAGKVTDGRHTPGVRLTLQVENVDRVDALTEPLVDLLFGDAAEGDSLTVRELQSWAKRHRTRFRSGMETWREGVEERAERLGFLEKGGGKHVAQAAAAAVTAAVIAFAMSVWGDDPWLLVPAGLLLVLAFLSGVMRRRSREASELFARYAALYRYLRDFGRLHEKPPEAVVLWEQYLVYAVVFGIADKVLAQMRVTVPEVLEDAGYQDVFWFTSPSAASSFGDAFGAMSSFSQGLSAAVIAASPPSSGSGSSGSSSSGSSSSGFSGGGGGGGGGAD